MDGEKNIVQRLCTNSSIRMRNNIEVNLSTVWTRCRKGKEGMRETHSNKQQRQKYSTVGYMHTAYALVNKERKTMVTQINNQLVHIIENAIVIPAKYSI